MPRTILLLVLVLAFVGVLSGCMSQDSADGADGRMVITVESIRSLAEDYNRAWEARDAAAIVGFHGEGFEYYWFDHLVTDGFEAVVRDEWLADTKEYRIEMLSPSVELLGPDAAVISFLFNDRQVFESDNVVTTEGALIYVFERRAGEIEIVRIHHSGAVPEEFK